MKHITGPNSGFVVITDCDGDVVTTVSSNSTVDHIYDLIRIYDKENPDDAPHSPWRSCAGGFTRVFDRVGT